LTAPAWRRVLGGLALAGIVAYAVIDAALWRLDPWYSLVGNPESDYGVGAHAWLLDVNFALRGAFSIAAAAAVAPHVRAASARRIGIGAVVVWAVCSAALALFPDSPPATGRIHLLLALVAFVAVAGGTIILSRGLRGAVAHRAWTALQLMSLLGAVFLIGLVVGPRVDVSGLLERIFLALELLWLATAVTACRFRAGVFV
jgi:hypothetical membrane protein